MKELFHRKNRLRLAVFDLDGTLTTIRSPFLYVSEALGKGEEAREFAKQYRDGIISYEDWGRQTVALWAGIQMETVISIVSFIPFRNGAIELVYALQQHGVFVALLSVAFEQHVGFRAKKLNINRYECNELVESEGLVTGEYLYRVNHSNKCEFVKTFQEQLGVRSTETLVTGDTTGDIAMFKEASVSMAIDPESLRVAEAATLTLKRDDWRNVFDLLTQYFDFD